MSQQSAHSRKRRKKAVLQHPPEFLELDLSGVAAGGKAIARTFDGRIGLVTLGIPGERVVAEVMERRSQYFEARAVKVLRTSPYRIEPRCRYFGQCGGCQLQHIAYDQQLQLKTQIVRDQLIRLGRFVDLDEHSILRPTIGMDDPWRYRNHMRFTVRRDGQVGLMQYGSRRFLRIDHCDIAHDRVNQVLGDVQDRTTGTRQLAIRVGQHTNDVLIHPRLRWRVEASETSIQSGQRMYTEVLRGRRYRISAAAFFQVNTGLAERLVQLVLDQIRAVGARLVVDAFAGVGVFASQIAGDVERVVAIEESPSAARDAAINLAGMTNVEWITGRVEDALPAVRPTPDVVVLDPPRRGLQATVIDALVSSMVKRVIYVSCDPATLSRDLRRFVDGGFSLASVQPIDMFPQTQHIECVATLDRNVQNVNA